MQVMTSWLGVASIKEIRSGEAGKSGLESRSSRSYRAEGWRRGWDAEYEAVTVKGQMRQVNQYKCFSVVSLCLNKRY